MDKWTVFVAFVFLITTILVESRNLSERNRIDGLVISERLQSQHDYSRQVDDLSTKKFKRGDKWRQDIGDNAGPEIYSFHVHSDIKYRYSRTLVTSRVVNKNQEQSEEVTFSVTLPETAFISKFVMEIDGKPYEAYVKAKEEAKQIYEDAQTQGQSAGLIEQNTRNSNVFNVNVNIKPEAKITFNLTYEELLQRRLGRYEQQINIKPDQISKVQDFKITVNIEESQNITTLRVPNLRNDVEAVENEEGNNKDAVIVRPHGNVANVTWTPSEKDQNALSEQGLTGKFIVQYDVQRDSTAGEILVMQGYFVHFFAPENLPPMRKHVVFILDTSGSMYGQKMKQLKESQIKILNDLSEDDFFNIITFSNDVHLWSPNDEVRTSKWAPIKPKRRFSFSRNYWLSIQQNLSSRIGRATSETLREPVPATKENIETAKVFINSLVASGGTNINGALINALNLTAEIKQAQKDYGAPSEEENTEITTTILPELENSIAEENVETTTTIPSTNTLKRTVKPQTVLPQNVQTMIIFLTDGEPTIGETIHEQILHNVRTSNANITVPIFSLAFGDGADFPFVRKVSLQNFGFARKIYEASDATLQLKGFYNELASPLLSNVTFNYTSPEYNVTNLTLTKFPTIFGGTEIAIAGILLPIDSTNSTDKQEENTTMQPSSVENVETSTVGENGLTAITTERLLQVVIEGLGREGVMDLGTPNVYSSSPIPWGIPALRPYPPRPTPPPTPEDQFLEKLWAYLTIQQLIDEDIASQGSAPPAPSQSSDVNSKTKNETKVEDTPKEKAMTLALKYGFVTPYTSLVVVKPNGTEVTNALSADPNAAVMDTNTKSASHLVNRIANHPAAIHLLSSGLSQLNVPSFPIISHPTTYNNNKNKYRPRPAVMSQQLQSLGQGFPFIPFIPQQMSQDVFPIRPTVSSKFTTSSTSTTTVPTQTTSMPSSENVSEKLKLSDILWLEKSSTTVSVNGTSYLIARKETEVSAIASGTACTVPGQYEGKCVLLKNCVQSELAKNFEIYERKYFCSIPSVDGSQLFAGSCCPTEVI